MRRALSLAQYRVGPSLDDSEQRLALGSCLEPSMAGAGPLGPRRRPIHRLPQHRVTGRQGGTDVQDHLDVGTDQPLDLHRRFRGHPDRRSVVNRGEGHPVIVHRGRSE